ncbi:OpgC family protein [Cryobacterium sp. 10C2]|nr:OpgC domain-containing protein [Cryobacterium sp. 10C2]MDY7527166.1 OpgC domain-containing protein [Cryobacterium sp. 10C2]MEB0290776.1 OpgC domain-containing protein [Cryobacterium sp. 10C2]
MVLALALPLATPATAARATPTTSATATATATESATATATATPEPAPTPAVTVTPAPATDGAPVSLEPTAGAYFGSILDWSGDSATEQASRLGSPSAFYEHSVSMPMSDADTSYSAQFLQKTNGAGSLPLLTIRPTTSLLAITADAATRLVDGIAAARGTSTAPLYLRFAPDMNSTWVSWGQQPSAYRQAFAAVADVVHRRLPGAVMVWSPNWGGGYPFTGTRAADTDTLRELDTNRDGSVDGGDAYAPYYPGAVADWVGLSVYHDDTAGGDARNTVPRDGELLARLGSPAADAAGDDDFFGRYSTATGTPFLLETAAFYSPSAGGPGELAIKQNWWRQVFAAVADPRYATLKAVLWQDTTATRAVVGGTFVDWSVTLGDKTRAAFAADLAASDLTLGPLFAPTTTNEAGASATGPGVTIGGWWAWLVAALVIAAVTLLFALAVARRGRSALSYDGPTDRDLRIDLLRGLAIVFVVVNHIGLVSLFQEITQEAIGIVSGAELFVLFAGVVLGMVYRPKIAMSGIGEVVIRTSRRAWKLYYTALAVVILIFAVSLLPFVNAGYLTTFTDQGTGARGSSASGHVYDLYANAGQLLTYPVNPHILLDLALLRLGPWQFNVMGLYVVLLLVCPLVLWALSKRWWVPVLALSWGLYLFNALAGVRLFPSEFEDSFPLLTWQVLFVTGIVAGYHRVALLRWFASRWGLVAAAVIVLLATALMLFSWSNPYLPSAFSVRLGLVPDALFRSIYGAFFGRTNLEPGRLLNVMLVVVSLYALVSAYWRPIRRALGWFLIPLGQATLYVFIMHVFFALIAANIPALQDGNVWLNTGAYVVILALLWVMVRTKFLFRIVPR